MDPRQQHKPVTGTATVTVACKLPHGFVLQLQKRVEATQPAMGGGLTQTTVWVPDPDVDPITIYGNAHPQNMAPIAPMANGFALTHGVPKDFWDAWVDQHKRLPAVKNGLIFAHENVSKSRDEAKEKANERTGLERIDPANISRDFSRRIETAEEIRKRMGEPA
jgi:hypothetical protein